MTFYNVISALLFVGAFRELLLALQAGALPQLWRASLLALLVFNDAIYTSWVVETRQQKYGPTLMSLDLINFMILSAALVFLNHSSTNVFSLDLERFAGAWLTEIRFWLLLAVYWSLIMWWTSRAGVYKLPKYPKWLIKWSLLIIALFVLQAVVLAIFGSASVSAVSHVGSFIAALYTAVYILGVRNYYLRSGID